MTWIGRLQRRVSGLRRSGQIPAYVVVGLGNPGARYAATRHNVGFRVCDSLAERRPSAWHPGRARMDEWPGTVAGVSVALLKPQTFVNDSGPAVVSSLRRMHAGPANLILVHDDLDLEFAKIRVRRGGSSGGHRGVRSVIEALGSEAFLRVKIGLGRPPPGVEPAAYVLEPFREPERPMIDQAVQRAADAVRALVRHEVEHVMQIYNG